LAGTAGNSPKDCGFPVAIGWVAPCDVLKRSRCSSPARCLPPADLRRAAMQQGRVPPSVFSAKLVQARILNVGTGLMHAEGVGEEEKEHVLKYSGSTFNLPLECLRCGFLV